MVDGRSDIYALGIVAWELLCGQPPFTGPDTRAILTAHLTADVPPLRDRRREVPAMLEEVIMRCLAKDPALRWPDAESLSRGFGRFAVEAAP
jgi:serine/threonine-protein kinase